MCSSHYIYISPFASPVFQFSTSNISHISRSNMSYKPTLLLFGVGPRTGTFIASKFAGAGYQVAATGRSVKDGPVRDGYLNIKADLADPAVVPEVFDKAQKHFGAPPNIVVYNGMKSVPSQSSCLCLVMQSGAVPQNFRLQSFLFQ
jgi:NAD(P)-dependent dehydrogenase (short-subunit alcohol dehydrogenase family)